MKTLKRIAVIFMLIVLLIIAVAVVITTRIGRRGLPDYNEELALKGLENKVTVYRDEFGIPHIYAESEHDLYLTTGYLMAQDRIWQMDLLRRVTQGRLSEIFGDDFIETDLLLRSLRFGEKSKYIINQTDPGILNTVIAYCEGVNQYIEKNRSNYPFEFVLLGYEPEPWEPVHTFNLVGYMAWDLKSGWKEILIEKLASHLDERHLQGILPESIKQEPTVYSYDASQLLAGNRLTELSKLEQLGLDVFSGSNTWAVSGSKTKSGKPLLANDMHLSFGIPGIWWQMHQIVGGKVNCTGLALPGQPYLIVGHTDSIAWGMTNTYSDNLDFYEERINPQDTNQYLYKGEWHNFELREEKIKSKGGTSHTRSYRLNHRGPVISSTKGFHDRVVSLHWAGDEPSNELRAIYKVNRANNWDDFREAFSTFRSISQNISYADKAGNIGQYCCAGVPIRNRDTLFTVLPGWTGKYDWKGMIPFAELPYEYNPERGYISSANNRTVDDSYPYHISTWYARPYRVDRIRELLNGKEQFLIDDFKSMQFDRVSKFSEIFLESMLPKIKSMSDWNDNETQAINLLSSWNYDMAPDNAAASVCELWSYYLLISVFEDEMGSDLFGEFLETNILPRIGLANLLGDPEYVWIDNINTEKTEKVEDVAFESFRNTIKELVTKQGSDTANWQWGNIQKLTLHHPLAKVDAINKIFKLNRGPFAVGGSYHTISQNRFPWFKPGNVEHGSSHRSVYDLSDWDMTISVIPTGNSGIPSSDFYCDQTEMFIQGDYHPDLFSEEAVKQNAIFIANYRPE